MSTTKHSPGPWEVEHADNGKWYWFNILSGNGGKVVCNTPDRESEANAKLIAAAPELLAAIEEIQQALKANPCDLPTPVMTAIGGAYLAFEKAAGRLPGS